MLKDTKKIKPVHRLYLYSISISRMYKKAAENKEAVRAFFSLENEEADLEKKAADAKDGVLALFLILKIKPLIWKIKPVYWP